MRMSWESEGRMWKSVQRVWGVCGDCGESVGIFWGECGNIVGRVWREFEERVRRMWGELGESVGRMWRVLEKCGECVGRV